MLAASIGEDVTALILAPLWLIAALALFWGAVRFVTWLFRPHGAIIPIIVQVSDQISLDGPKSTNTTRAGHDSERRADELATRVKEYMAQDATMPAVNSPGGLRSAVPQIPSETSSSTEGTLTAMVWGAVSEGPRYELVLTPTQRLDDDTGSAQAWNSISIEITRKPKGCLIGTHIVRQADEEKLVEEIGSYCLHQIRSQHKFLKHIPRWHHWGTRSEAYGKYRNGITYQNEARYQDALASYKEGISLAPSNLTLRSAKAELHELIGNEEKKKGNLARAQEQYREAFKEYQLGTSLWPESIEVSYRMAIAIANRADSPHGGRPDADIIGKGDEVLSRLKIMLRRRNIFKLHSRAFRPGYRNAGERAYWKSWYTPHFVGHRMVTARKRYLLTIEISESVRHLKKLKRDYEGAPSTDPAVLTNRQREVWELTQKTITKVTTKRIVPGKDRLFSKNLGPNSTFNSGKLSKRIHKRGIGWVARYNTACFFSRAIELSFLLGSSSRSENSKKVWSQECAQIAREQLAMVYRDPSARPTRQWSESDPDLQPLLEWDKDFERLIGGGANGSVFVPHQGAFALQ